MNILEKKWSVFFLFFVAISGIAQSSIEGVVADHNSNPIIGASLQILELKEIGAISDFEGKFTIPVAQGTYTLEASYIGFKKNTQKVTISSDTVSLTIILQEDIEQLKDVVIKGKTEVRKIKEKAFEVEVVEAKGLKNISIDVNSVLNTVPGVIVRQSGGLGSNFNFSLNGFSGNQVKFFINGIPQDNLGTSLTLNNFPATLIERAEVYKGVVPVYLGADALGGAINIITNKKRKDFLDVSYDTGSFNTHRATLNGHYYSKKGLTFQLSSFFNYSDNDYTIDNIVVRDELGNDTGVRRNNVRRFHDAYRSQMMQAKTGLVNHKIADQLLIGITASSNDNEVQHPIDPQNPFGEVTKEEQVVFGSIAYKKDSIFSHKLKLKVYAELAKVKSKTIDTSSRKYDWFGNFIIRNDATRGELEGLKTLFEFNDSRHIINTSLEYAITAKNSLHFNYTKNYLEREGKDPARAIRTAFRDPHVIDKNILGLSYDLEHIKSKLKTTVFSKVFFANTKGTIEDLFDNNPETRFASFENRYDRVGYGLASSFEVAEGLQFKGSFEKTFRIPEGFELFGDGLLLEPNPILLPEQSNNFNFGLLWEKNIDNVNIKLDTNFFFRDTKNLFFLQSEGITSQYINLASTKSLGVEGEISTTYKDNFYLVVNATYQNIRDTNVNERIANLPFLFGNFRTGYNFENVVTHHDKATLSWDSFFVQEFPFQSFENGNPDLRLIIPQQLSHNAQIGYSFKEGTYNIFLQVRNVTNVRVFDHLNIQKPGRAFYIKLRYYISN